MHGDDGATHPASSGLELKALLLKALALLPSAKQFPFYTELTSQRLLGLYRSAKTSHSGC